MSVYNMFNLTNAYGVQVDNIVALNGIQRKNQTYTVIFANVTATQAVTIPGMDALALNPNAQIFTIADIYGNQYQLITTYSFSSAGTVTLQFQAVIGGPISTYSNTITVINTPVVGISSVNNPTTASDIIGVGEETDVQLKVRMAQSFMLSATGPADTIRAQLLNIQGIVDAFVAENDNASIQNGVFANGIMTVINNSSATPAQIAQVIYSKKPAGTTQTAVFTSAGTITSGTNTITSIPTTANMAVGQGISGTGIPTNTTITAVNSANEITISNNATANGTSFTVTPVGTLNSYNITRPAGNIFTATWFSALQQNFFASFTINPINGIDQFNAAAIATSLSAALIFKLNQSCFVGTIINAMLAIAPNAYLTGVQVGASSPASGEVISPMDYQHYLVLPSANITITTV